MFINIDTASVNGFVSDRPFVINTDAIAYAYPVGDGVVTDTDFESAMASKDVRVVLTNGKEIRITLKKKNFKEFVDYLHAKTDKERVEISNPKTKSGSEISLHITQ